jgi:predicted metalloprotease with PDZ domain
MVALLLSALLLPSSAALSQTTERSAPAAVPIAPSVPDAADTAYPGGPIRLDIDASDITRATFQVTETIPLAPGTDRLTLLFPQWLPGKHGPRGALAELVDVHFSVAGKPVAWLRDPVEVNAFHLRLPAGAREVVARFVHTSPLQPSEGRIAVTPEMLNLQWEAMSLYPAGHYVRRIRFRPSVTFPAGWTPATALDGGKPEGNRWSWGETDYATLVDSPIFAGKNYRKWDLGQRVTLHLFADKPDQLAATDTQIALHRNLVAQARAAYGANHFDHYEFLLAASDKIGGIGLEHHRSSENQVENDAFTAWEKNEYDRGILPHEYSHSWWGKFRRPARLWTPDYRQPMQGDLLWAYEGLDQFWGLVLAARSGLQGRDVVLGQLAAWAGNYSTLPGRQWRSIEDTGSDPIFAARKAKPFPSLSRGEDYYTEGALVWLEADQIIRAGSGGTRSLDDFAKAFGGMRDGDWGELTFELPDVVAALNGVYRYDWDVFLRTRLMQPGQPAPLGGIERGGYRLVWKEVPNPFDKQRMASNNALSLSHSLGISLDKEGKVTATQWDSPAFNAGIVPGSKIVAVGGTAYDADGIKDAITAGKAGTPIELLVQRGDRYQTVRIDYRGGLRWPWIERARNPDRPAPLDLTLAPLRIAG